MDVWRNLICNTQQGSQWSMLSKLHTLSLLLCKNRRSTVTGRCQHGSLQQQLAAGHDALAVQSEDQGIAE